jgi:hypothetical protein
MTCGLHANHNAIESVLLLESFYPSLQLFISFYAITEREMTMGNYDSAMFVACAT